jgi:RND family efflux transporter MFP subunit
MDLEPLKINRDRPSSRRSAPWLPRLVAGAAVLLVLGALFVFWRPLTESVDSVRLPEVRALRVKLSHPAAVGAVRGMAANGYVVASRRAALSADTPGRIVELNVTEGSVVKKGDVVARLYSDEYEAGHRRAQADQVAAKAVKTRADAALVSAKRGAERSTATARAAGSAVQAEEAERALAKQELVRVETLYAEGVASTQNLQRTQAAFSGRSASVRRSSALHVAAETAAKAAEAAVGVAEADVQVAVARCVVASAATDLAKATLDKTLVVAPFDGVVVLKAAEVGEVVSPNVQGGSASRGSVVTMVDFASLEVQADVPETSLGAVVIGAPAQIFLDAYPEEAYAARVERIWPTANRSKATVEVRLSFLALDDRLRPEMSVRVVFLPADAVAVAGRAEAPALLVPDNVIVSLGGAEGVFVLERDVASFRAVRQGKRRAGRVEIVEGLKPGERIVMDPPPSLEDGGRVRIKKD